jgi:hypothetical protein
VTPPGLIAIAAGAALLLLVGARLDRYLLKRRLEVLDGTAGHEDIDLTEVAGGGRS